MFFSASCKAWEKGVVSVLETLEEEIVGPYALRSQIVSPPVSFFC
jgi:hypothetical protein